MRHIMVRAILDKEIIKKKKKLLKIILNLYIIFFSSIGAAWTEAQYDSQI